MRRLTPYLFRGVSFAALLLLLWNPTLSRAGAGGETPLVLLDASLSMQGHGGDWRAALDSARRLARGGPIWRFGDGVQAFDSAAPAEGASRLGPALAAAAARGGALVVVSDGEVSDAGTVPPDLLARARVVVLPRAPFSDAYLAAVSGPGRVSVGDTLILTVSAGRAGPRSRLGPATIVVSVAGRTVATKPVQLPDSGVVSVAIAVPAARLPTGWSALEVAVSGDADGEPRDDGRRFVVDVTAEPAVVLLAAPPDWESHFLARALADVARLPVKEFALVDPATGGGWRDGLTLAPVSAADVARAVAGARLVAELGDPRNVAQFRVRGATLRWPTAGGDSAEWYAFLPPTSPFGAALGGVAWDSLPPAARVIAQPVDSGAAVALAAQAGRRGTPRPVVLLSESGGARRATVLASGLWRWGFRGGASGVAYRELVGALTDWLVAAPGAAAERATPERYATPDGLPFRFRWTGPGRPHDLAVTLAGPSGTRVDTLRFDAGGTATLALPPGEYRYALAGGSEQGLLAAETYSDEWRPQPVTLRAQRGSVARVRGTLALRDRWWLFTLAVVALLGEWAWRRREGLP